MSREMDPHKAFLPELRRVQDDLAKPAKGKKMEAFFTADNLCESSVAELNKQLAALGITPGLLANDGRQAWIGVQDTVQGAVGAGAQIGVMMVGNLYDEVGIFWFYGEQLVTNAEVGASVELLIFPRVKMEDFPGLAWGVGFSAGEVVNGNLDVMFTDRILGFGVGPGLGAGVFLGDLAVGQSYTQRIR